MDFFKGEMANEAGRVGAMAKSGMTAGAKEMAMDKLKGGGPTMDDAKNFMSKNMANLKDFAMGGEKLKFNIPHKVKKVIAGGSIKEDVIEDMENGMGSMSGPPAGDGAGDESASHQSEPDSNISLAKLIAHMDQVHPRNEMAENFATCAELGSYNNPLFKLPCIADSPIAEMAKELGIGPTMFLMSIKQLIKLFFVFTALNFPLYILLSKSHDDSRGGADMNTFFASFTMGALGQGEPTCTQMNLLTESSINLKCGHPYATIVQINTIGIANKNDNTCATAQFKTRNQAEQDFVNGCYSNHKIDGAGNAQKKAADEENFLQKDEADIKAFYAKFIELCMDKNECVLDYKDLLVQPYCNQLNYERLKTGKDASKDGYSDGYEKFKKDQTEKYQEAVARKAGGGNSDTRNDQNPLMMVTYNCRNDVVVVSASAGGFTQTSTMDKSGFITLIVGIDVICTCILMAFYRGLVLQQENYFKRYDTETLTITKFSYMLSNLPADEFFNNDDNILRMRLWLQMEKILQEQGERENPLMPNDFMDCKYQMTDIQFAKNNNFEGPLISDYIENKEELKKENARLVQYEQERKESDIEKTKKKIEKIEEKMQKGKDKLKEMKAPDHKSQVGGTDSLGHKKPPSTTCECLKKRTIIYAFITFRSMDGKELYRKSYARFDGWSEYRKKCLLRCGCCCPKLRDHLKSLYIGGKWPKIEEAIMADNIIWQNMSVSERERRMRIRVANFLGFLALLLSFIVLTLLNTRSVELKAAFKVPSVCPLEISQKQALDDHENENSQVGLMHCFCQHKLMGKGISMDSMDIKFTAKDGSEQFYCDDWAVNFASQKAIYQGQAWILNFVNGLIQATFSFLVLFQKRFTLNEQTVAAFQYKLGLEYINMAIIPLLTAFKLSAGGLNELGIFSGHYDDFSVEWYREIGATICYTAFLNTFQPHVNLFIEYGKVQYKRYKDRGWEKELKSETAECNTQMVLQEDLEKLYTGEPVDGSTLYTNFMIQLLVTFTYCAGLPVLYIIAFFNYISLYWSYKFLFLKFYQKTTDFNEGLPMYCVKYIKIAVFLHFAVSMAMLTNRDIMEPDKAFGKEEAASSTRRLATNSNGSFRRVLDSFDFDSWNEGVDPYRMLVEAPQFQLNDMKQEASDSVDRLSDRFYGGTVAGMYLGFVGTVAFIYFFGQRIQRAWNRSICGRLLNPIFLCFKKIICCFINLCCKAKEDDLSIFSDDLISELKMQSLHDLLKRSEREYKAVRLIPVEALPWDCDPQMIQDAKTSLKKRIEAVHGAIDRLVTLALKEAGASHATPWMHEGFDYNKLTTQLKYATAAENSKLIAKQINQNRMAIMRMKGVTQSYDMYDSQLYKQARIIMKEMMK